jgi:hypothetical protein
LIYLQLVAVAVAGHHWVAVAAEAKLFLKQVLLQLGRQSFPLLVVVQEALEAIPHNKIMEKLVVEVVT